MRTEQQIIDTILEVVGSAAAIQVKIHDVAMECLEHAKEHGDARLADRLVKELEAKAAGQRTATLREWFTKFSPIRWSTKEDTVGLQKEGVNKDFTPFDIKGAKAKPYYQLGKETRPRELTLEQLKKSLTRLQTQIENAEAGKGNARIKEGEDLAAMKALAKAAGLVAQGGRVELAA